VLTFGSALLMRSEKDLWALVVIGVAWLIVPILALTDRIEFDGQTLSRRGPAPFLARLIVGREKRLSIADFEKVDTQALRTLRRGGRVRYRYRTQIVGKSAEFIFASGGGSYREMVRQLFPLIHRDKLDIRTLELADYLCDPKELNAEVRSLHLASDEVLDSATMDFKLGRKRSELIDETQAAAASQTDRNRATLLGKLGNHLRVAGRLSEAREALRRALIADPTDGHLIFAFARLLRSQATSLSDARLLSRSRAAMRLSAMRAGNEPDLLAQVGETFLDWGETARAQSTFQKAIDLAPANFRARMGLANLALRDGKLAHVIHQYRDAARSASEKALVAYARREADYYATLNDDDNYLVTELRRINWLQHSLRVRRLSARVTNAGILVALIVPYIDPSVEGFCWSLATSSLAARVLSLFAIRILAQRRTPRVEVS
jgi:tetratricopeptide (TPR) repeat protein